MIDKERIKRNREIIESIYLDPVEIEAAIFEGKKKKYFYLRGKQYYIDQETICKESKITQTKLSSQS